MPSRLTATLFFLACISSSHLSYGQQIVGDVPVSWIGLGGFSYQCDQKGQVFYRPDYRNEKDDHQSVVRVNRDGSTLLFQTPDERDWIAAFAPANNGLVVVASFLPGTSDGRPSPEFHLYHFDNKANVVTSHTVSFDFRPFLTAVTSSGKRVVVGLQPPYHKKLPEVKFGGAVLDVDDKVTQLFEFPPTAEGGNWAPGLIQGGDGVAYAVLKDEGSTKLGAPQNYSVATIGESGHVDIDVLPVPTDDRTHYLTWLFGPGVAVAEYSIDRDTPRVRRFDEYDLTSGKRLRTKITPPLTLSTQTTTCYLGDEIVWMGQRGDADQQSIRRVTVKLEAATLHN